MPPITACRPRHRKPRNRAGTTSGSSSLQPGRASDPRVGANWAFGAACTPSDDVVFLMSTGTAETPPGPLGLLELDPTQGIHVRAVARAAATEIDPHPVRSLAIRFRVTRIGIGLHVQPHALRTTSAEGPHLSIPVRVTIR